MMFGAIRPRPRDGCWRWPRTRRSRCLVDQRLSSVRRTRRSRCLVEHRSSSVRRTRRSRCLVEQRSSSVRRHPPYKQTESNHSATLFISSHSSTLADVSKTTRQPCLPMLAGGRSNCIPSIECPAGTTPMAAVATSTGSPPSSANSVSTDASASAPPLFCTCTPTSTGP